MYYIRLFIYTGLICCDRRQISDSNLRMQKPASSFARKSVDGWLQYLCLENGCSRAVVAKDWKYMANRPSLPVGDRMEADKQRSSTENRFRLPGWNGINNGGNKPGVWFGADPDFPAYFEKDQLCDLGKDPFEQDNPASGPKYKRKLDKMKDLLHKAPAFGSHPFGEFSSVNPLR